VRKPERDLWGTPDRIRGMPPSERLLNAITLLILAPLLYVQIGLDVNDHSGRWTMATNFGAFFAVHILRGGITVRRLLAATAVLAVLFGIAAAVRT